MQEPHQQREPKSEDEVGIPPVSVNVQAVVGVVVVSFFMIAVTRNFKVVIDNQKVIYDGLKTMNENICQLGSDSVTVRDVVKLAAQATPAA